MHLKNILIIAAISLLHITSNAQQNLKGWHLLDSKKDSIQGISLQPAYELLKGKKSTQVVVAVIDSGVDTTHEDLKKILWTNHKEIAGNGKDDDGNGYIDDVNGWNFIGGKDGRNIEKESAEATRVFHRYKEKFYSKPINENELTPSDKEEFALWNKAAGLLEVDKDEQVSIMFLEVAFKAARKNETILKQEMKIDTFDIETVENFQPQTNIGKQAKMGYLNFIKITGIEKEETNASVFEQLEDYLQSKKAAIEAKDVPPVNYRMNIIKDDYYNMNDRFYGNNDVMGPSSKHGTHVSGIIAAQRNNNVGIEGVADNVRIMSIRAVPDGDEYDKDVALAIKYAVDNGAKVINMSFGKSISPEKKWVDEAVKYAELKDVLLIHAAGNDGKNNDEIESFPNKQLKTLNATASNFIAVGASSDLSISNNLVAEFSNYGAKSVDVFAPGEKIYSTLPGGNVYGFQSGTSMAAPVVSGVAALIRSYYPLLSARQVKYIIESSVDKENPVSVVKPGSKEKVFFGELSLSGGTLNAYNAVKLASTLKPENRVEEKKEILPKASLKKSTINQ